MTKERIERIKQYKGRFCDFCGKGFDGSTSWQRFCQPSCHDLFWKGNNLPAKIVAIEKRVEKIEKAIGIKP